MTKSSKIVFFGSGPVAAKSLELLLKDFEVEAVITKPAIHTGKDETPVLDIAKAVNLPYYTALNKYELDKVIKSTHFQSQIAILIDFGIIISKEVIRSEEHTSELQSL